MYPNPSWQAIAREGDEGLQGSACMRKHIQLILPYNASPPWSFNISQNLLPSVKGVPFAQSMLEMVGCNVQSCAQSIYEKTRCCNCLTVEIELPLRLLAL